ncbi:MAG: hypothetical protein QNJ98_17245 [Planctomycetota bacterium]|nr:hypothetical protein [Planctomycetota bacterium]
MKIRPHKLASVVRRLGLGPEVTYSRRVEVRDGQVLVVRALEEKRIYDVMELTTGRMAHVGKGDVIVGCLGRRDALQGFVGRIPESIKAGDTINLLNLGGLLGNAVSENRDVGHPLRCEVLGMVTRDGVGVNIADAAIPEPPAEAQVPPLIVVSGTCMNSGKTYAACEIIARLTQRGYTVGGAKLTGVAAVRDPLNMEDHGARPVLTFHDVGHPSTSGLEDVAPIAKRVLRSIQAEAGKELDVVVVEMGDGVIGRYGVETILRDPEFRSWIRAHVLTANDLVAAWGGVRWMAENDLSLDVIAGPATDNSVGIKYVEQELGVAAGNARTDPDAFVDKVEEAAFTRTRA